MNDFDSFFKDRLKQPEVRREYYRLAPFYELANQLLLLRKKRGLSQQELAEKAETTQAVVSRLENATVKCSLDTVVRLAEAMDAIVEVNLKLLEEIHQENEAEEVVEDECEDELIREQEMGAVFFGSKAPEPCRAAMMYWVDPITKTLKDPKKMKRRALEIA